MNSSRITDDGTGIAAPGGAGIGAGIDVEPSSGGGGRLEIGPAPGGSGGPGVGSAPGSNRMRVLLVDDHPLYREGMGMVLTTMTDVEVVGQAGDGESAVSLAVDSGRTWS